ncbi:MAG: transglycosylase SLT domain-containing protein, partial [Myxococcota bacterium]
PATKSEYGQRNIRLMELGAWKAVSTNLSGKLGDYSLGTVEGCQVHYAYGRSQFKRNQVTIASNVLIPVGKLCKDATPDLGAKAFYIAGKSLERKKEYTRAAQTYERIPKTYPEHSMADDGYALAGIAYTEAGNRSQAMRLWTAQVDEYPEGDLAGEGFWRLAWTAYQNGQPDVAIDWAERMVAEVPLKIDPTHIIAGKYWSARWRLYPNVKQPRTLNTNKTDVAAGIDLLAALCTEHPNNFYSLFAANRLRELAPEKLAAVPYPEPAVAAETWSVRTIFLEEPATKRALALARLGLAKDAMSELDTLGKELTPSEMTIVTDIRSVVNPYSAHDRLHHYLLHHPPSTLGPDQDRILLQSLPNHYWDLVEEVTEGYRFDPRIFHALVREESSFNKDIRSWAGARGLSQLMPGTARRVGQWLGLKVSTSQLGDPKLNLQIGSRYLEYLFKYFNDNPFLAVAAYNAGEGNVGKWKTRFGDVPTDEFVESIPFRETRGYVKRVLGTYQNYRVTRGDAKEFPDWGHTTHHTGPSRP